MGSSALLTLLALVGLSIAAPSLSARQLAIGSEATGWWNLPTVEGATVHRDWPMKGHTFPIYLTTATTEEDTSHVKRAVIFVPGKWRDCWTQFKLADEALKEYSDEVSYEDVSIMSPCFLTDLDRIGAASLDNILFGKTTWVSGHKNIEPTDIEVSAFEVIDELIDYYLDKDKFPALEAVVFAGHSAGGQMTQRYAALKKEGKHEDRVHYWVANPGSLLWLTKDRPNPDKDCEGVDSYKYGLQDSIPAYALGDANDLGRKGMVNRYLARNIHYAFGLLDHGAGDTRCQAVTQGSTHLERGQNFMDMLDGLGGMPENSTVDYIPGVTHDGNGMVKSDAGLEKLFKYV